MQVPVIASGGVGNRWTIWSDGVTEGHASAVLAASIFHFGEVSIAQAKAALARPRTFRFGRSNAPRCILRQRALHGWHARALDLDSRAWTIPALLPFTRCPATAWAPRSRSRRGPPASIAAMRPEDAFRATLSDCLAQMTANAATLRAGRSVEGLHQLRVAFRRLEVALNAFGEEFQPGLAGGIARPRQDSVQPPGPGARSGCVRHPASGRARQGRRPRGLRQPARPRGRARDAAWKQAVGLRHRRGFRHADR